MRLTVALMAALGVVGNGAVALGEIVTYGFSGRVVASYWSLLDGLPVLHEEGVAWLPNIDDEVSGRITLDTSLPLRRPYTPPGVPPWLPLDGTYVAPSAVEVTIDGHRWSSSVLGINVDDDRQQLDGNVVDAIRLGSFSMVSTEVPLGEYSMYLSLTDLGGDLYHNGEWTRDLTTTDIEPEQTNLLAWAATGPPLWFSIQSWDRVANRRIGDFNGDSALTIADVNELERQTRMRNGRLAPDFDFTGDGVASSLDVGQMVHSLFGTYVGDANLDRSFDTSDLLLVFQANQYEDGISLNSDWSSGDWNGDGEFDTNDLVTAFQDGGYEAGPRPAVNAVPEPSGLILFGMGLCGVWRRRVR